MKVQLNSLWRRTDSEVDLFRKMSDVLKLTYNLTFVQETHQRRITYYSNTISQNAQRELSDLWIIAFSPSQKRIRTTFLQAKYHRANLLPSGIFHADYFQFELLSTRANLLNGGTFNFPLDTLSSGCCDSVGCYGIFYIDNSASIDMAYCTAKLLSNTSVPPTSYRQVAVNLSFPNLPIAVNNCSCNVCSELNYTYDIDFFTQNLLELNIGAEVQFHPTLLTFIKGLILTLPSTTAVNQLINTIDNIFESRDIIVDTTGNAEDGSPNILIINVDEKASH